MLRRAFVPSVDSAAMALHRFAAVVTSVACSASAPAATASLHADCRSSHLPHGSSRPSRSPRRLRGQVALQHYHASLRRGVDAKASYAADSPCTEYPRSGRATSVIGNRFRAPGTVSDDISHAPPASYSINARCRVLEGDVRVVADADEALGAYAEIAHGAAWVGDDLWEVADLLAALAPPPPLPLPCLSIGSVAPTWLLMQ